MFPRNLHRGVMAIVFAAALALASARPAAAEGFSWREAWDWMGRAWSGFTLLQPAAEASRDCGLEIDPNGRPCLPPGAVTDPNPIPQGDCGLEIDPDGRCRA
ncbi:MAG TPA: hypothetical protein VN493_06635 [Thermoanaerobaculia bacterium]|nr:hypothetical protein [Thermoanaerobaculia bacterium]